MLEYVYSVANNGTEFELGGILEKTIALNQDFFRGANYFDQTYAATTQNITAIKGNYNGVSLKVAIASPKQVYVVAVPTLIDGYLGNGTMETSVLALENHSSLPMGFSGTVVSSSSNTGGFTPIVAWNGPKLPETAGDVQALVDGLQAAYSGSAASDVPQVSTLLSTSGSAELTYGNGLLSTTLGGAAVSTSGGSSGGGIKPGFILVPGNATFGTSDFYVAKYEMKVAGGAPDSLKNGHKYLSGETIVSTANDVPIVTLSQEQAMSGCQSMGEGYHLITNNEWMTIARNIEQVGSNWSSGTKGSGYIFSGHNDSDPNTALSASTDDTKGYFNTLNSSGDQRRTLTLSNGNVIWDLAGNVWEHVNKANTPLDGSGYASTTNLVSNACG